MNRTDVIVGARALVFGLVAISVVMPAAARAHCDGLDGPVVADARAALEGNDVARVLIWVPESDEAEIRRAFDETVRVRKLGEPARELADRYFFETVVRVHRMAEGAPYTGLKPAGRDLGAAIPAADRALEIGDPEPLLRLLTAAVQKGVRAHFSRAHATRRNRFAEVPAGRQHVAEYVLFIHFVDRLYQSATSAVHGHEAEVDPSLEHTP